MDGIEILKSIEITTTQSWIVWGIIISLGIVIMIGIILHDSEIDSTPSIIACIIGITAAIAFVFFIMAAIIAPKKPTGEYKQIMRVPDDISLNEFYEKYEILSKEEYTNVYTVKERIIK